MKATSHDPQREIIYPNQFFDLLSERIRKDDAYIIAFDPADESRDRVLRLQQQLYPDGVGMQLVVLPYSLGGLAMVIADKDKVSPIAFSECFGGTKGLISDDGACAYLLLGEPDDQRFNAMQVILKNMQLFHATVEELTGALCKTGLTPDTARVQARKIAALNLLVGLSDATHRGGASS